MTRLIDKVLPPPDPKPASAMLAIGRERGIGYDGSTFVKILDPDAAFGRRAARQLGDQNGITMTDRLPRRCIVEHQVRTAELGHNALLPIRAVQEVEEPEVSIRLLVGEGKPAD